MKSARFRAARVLDIASAYHDQACAEAARQCGLFYAPTVEPTRAVVETQAGQRVEISSPARNWAYIQKTFFTTGEPNVAACR